MAWRHSHWNHQPNNLISISSELVLLSSLHLFVQVGQESIPGDTAVTAVTPCQSYAIRDPINVTFTVSALGPGSSGPVGVVMLFPAEANLSSISVKDPTGLGAQYRLDVSASLCA